MSNLNHKTERLTFMALTIMITGIMGVIIITPFPLVNANELLDPTCPKTSPTPGKPILEDPIGCGESILDPICPKNTPWEGKPIFEKPIGCGTPLRD